MRESWGTAVERITHTMNEKPTSLKMNLGILIMNCSLVKVVRVYSANVIMKSVGLVVQTDEYLIFGDFSNSAAMVRSHNKQHEFSGP